ncbi:DUF956 family protein [Streptococcus ratti]|uniref:DUF956 family protein n=2 Tax=Streptococcus ratti TaxID=1341 RepID=A0A7X9LFK8_STRRT|nr:DUF956 family protein [Streptococcus ratti]VEI59384.1 mannose operon ManO protein [Streptococcus mutans]EJN94946.1 hypothetical protein SRA_01142 [Streptococcus ratti FA-1 = DSM 20564]EMP69268.1 putative mannose operon ManO protein [Streptococcus ratti FA-1 = DSM 20564]NMD49942.1 DUF956 family protein [Streptococcus ratti]QEY06963.1 DUF956 family protein [Streptococcus ratti]
MAQSINTKVEYTGKGVSYLGIGGKVGKFLLGDRGFEFYNDANVEHFIQIPWTSIIEMGANVSRKKVSRHFEIVTDQGKFLFASSDSGKILKIAREHIGNDKVLRYPSLIQKIASRFSRKHKTAKP